MEGSEEKISGGISLPRTHLIILICAAVAIPLALGYGLAPLIQSKLQHRGRSTLPTVLASSQPPKPESLAPVAPSVETASFDQLHQMAENGDPAAQNILGLRYATGEGVKLDEREAVGWYHQSCGTG